MLIMPIYLNILVLLALNAAGFQKPTPTQAQVWPIALAGRDVITVAKTGSGTIISDSLVLSQR